MATVLPGFGTAQASAPVVLQAATVLTSAYAASTNDTPTLGWNCCRFGIDYVKGDETTVQIKPEGFDGTTWRALTFKATQVSGASELTKDIIQLTPANFAASDSIATPIFDCRGFQKVRASQQATGGTPTGTLAVSVTFGMDVVG